MLNVTSKAPGQRQPLSPPFQVPPPAEVLRGEPVTLERLIRVTVQHELAAFAERRQERSLVRVLSERDLSVGLDTGSVRSEDRRSPAPPSEEQAVETALEAFRDGLFLVLVDGTQCTALDAAIPLTADSAITYVRLVALAGG